MQAIRTRYCGATNTRGARMQAKCEAKTIYIPYPYGNNDNENHKLACEALIRAMGWHPPHGRYAPMIGGFFGGAYYWVFADDVRAEVTP